MGKVSAAIDQGGFNFDLCRRNEMLMSKSGFKPPTYRKTGTTIVGLVFQDGIILGADTRATEGPIVADKNCEKIHYMAPNIYCCGVGTARYRGSLHTWSFQDYSYTARQLVVSRGLLQLLHY
ncbi:hypothetical protein IFM89_006033 [Coptis chinensis]|uniref:Uncharacterized protein n=1 Tax=Coptis chinensis TaxID=261450 RepID=A0A835I0C0_9MAGN|nr:hypothetical protein IFM89_006033 [Coptis chinensis]